MRADHRALACLATLLGCGLSSEGEHARTPERHFTGEAWDTVWVRRQNPGDTVIQYPTRIASDGRHVFVVDAAYHRVVALRAADGHVAWSRDTDDEGAPLFDEAAAIALGTHGGVLLADSHAGYLVQVDSSGARARRMRLRGVPFILSMCMLRDESLILHTLQSPPLRHLRVGQHFTTPVPFPWSDAGELAPLALQGLLAPASGGDRCVLALGLGRGFSTVGADSAGTPRPYVEALALPSVHTSSSQGKNERTEISALTTHQGAALAVSVANGEIAIPFVGRTPARARIIDIYAEGSGSYLRSLLYPHRPTDLVRVGSTYYSVDGPRGAVLAVTPRGTQGR